MPEKKPITDERARQFYVHAYAWDMGETPSPGQERAREVQAREWDRWLAAHDARVRAEAAREALDGLADQELRHCEEQKLDPDGYHIHSLIADAARTYCDTHYSRHRGDDMTDKIKTAARDAADKASEKWAREEGWSVTGPEASAYERGHLAGQVHSLREEPEEAPRVQAVRDVIGQHENFVHVSRIRQALDGERQGADPDPDERTEWDAIRAALDEFVNLLRFQASQSNHQGALVLHEAARLAQVYRDSHFGKEEKA